MLRRSARRLGHQLIKEPMGHEESSMTRGQRTMQHAFTHVYWTTGFCAVGCVAALYSLACARNRVFTIITNEGTVTKGVWADVWNMEMSKKKA